MSAFKTLPVSKISVSKDRSREVDEDHALAIQASIVENGQITPVLVRQTPNGKKAYELVAGAHRHRAIELLGSSEEIDCIVVKADKHEAAILEVSENIFRNELTALDRAFSVQVYRDAWEQKYGKIKRGHNNLPNSANLAELVSEEAGKGFSESCAEKLGLSKRAVERASLIAKNLPNALRKKLQGTPAADNQSTLERLARLEPQLRNKAAKAIDLSKGDVAAAIDLLEDKKPVKHSREQQLLSKLMDNWGRANEKVKKQFMDQAGLSLSKPTKD